MTSISSLIKKINLSTNKKVYSLFIGAYTSVFKGRGIDFEDLREYVPGDNVKDIDWNATARTGKVYIRKYIETRELTVLFAIDCSSSMNWNPYEKDSNIDLILSFIFLICLAAQRNADKFGAILFTNEIGPVIPYRKGKTHMLRILSETRKTLRSSYFQKTELNSILKHLLYNTRKRLVVFLITDSMEIANAATIKRLRAANKRHEITLVSLSTIAKLTKVVNRSINVQDIETGSINKLPFDDPVFREEMQNVVRQVFSKQKHMLKKARIDTFQLDSVDTLLKDLVLFFRNKKNTRKY